MARPDDPLERAERALERLRPQVDWDVPTNPVNKPAIPSLTPSPLRIVVATVQRFPPWGAVLVALAAIAGYVALALAGKAPVP
jgi:molybdopterin-guanine dinucleotide biosynthesis protein A